MSERRVSSVKECIIHSILSLCCRCLGGTSTSAAATSTAGCATPPPLSLPYRPPPSLFPSLPSSTAACKTNVAPSLPPTPLFLPPHGRDAARDVSTEDDGEDDADATNRICDLGKDPGVCFPLPRSRGCVCSKIERHGPFQHLLRLRQNPARSRGRDKVGNGDALGSPCLGGAGRLAPFAPAVLATCLAASLILAAPTLAAALETPRWGQHHALAAFVRLGPERKERQRAAGAIAVSELMPGSALQCGFRRGGGSSFELELRPL